MNAQYDPLDAKCPDCGGAGKLALLTSATTCPRCNGVGRILLPGAAGALDADTPTLVAGTLASPLMAFDAQGRLVSMSWTQEVHCVECHYLDETIESEECKANP